MQVPTKTNIIALVRTLEAFGWIREDSKFPDNYELTTEGKSVAEESLTKPKDFRRRLALKLHERYVIPGWFVARLHSLMRLTVVPLVIYYTKWSG